MIYSADKVAIVIVSYGRPKLLTQTLDSLSANTDPNLYRLIVVDSGSDAKVRQMLSTRDDIDELVLLKRNAGKPYAWNYGFLSTYNICENEGDELPDYFVFCDSDLYFKPGWLPKFLDIFKRHEYLNLGTVSAYAVPCGEFKIDKTKSDNEVQARRHPPGCCLMINRKTVEAVGLFDSKVKIRGVDTSYTRRLWSAGYINMVLVEGLVEHTGTNQRTWELVSGKSIYFKE